MEYVPLGALMYPVLLPKPAALTMGETPASTESSGEQVDVDGAWAGALVEEAHGDLAGRRGEGLVLEHGHLGLAAYATGKHSVLAAFRKNPAHGGELLLRARGIGGVGVRAGRDRDIGADGAEADVVKADGGVLGGCRAPGRVGRGVDDANLRDGLDAGDALAGRPGPATMTASAAKRAVRIARWGWSSSMGRVASLAPGRVLSRRRASETVTSNTLPDFAARASSRNLRNDTNAGGQRPRSSRLWLPRTA